MSNAFIFCSVSNGHGGQVWSKVTTPREEHLESASLSNYDQLLPGLPLILGTVTAMVAPTPIPTAKVGRVLKGDRK
jgi:hypothetical protein